MFLKVAPANLVQEAGPAVDWEQHEHVVGGHLVHVSSLYLQLRLLSFEHTWTDYNSSSSCSFTRSFRPDYLQAEIFLVFQHVFISVLLELVCNHGSVGGHSILILFSSPWAGSSKVHSVTVDLAQVHSCKKQFRNQTTIEQDPASSSLVSSSKEMASVY